MGKVANWIIYEKWGNRRVAKLPYKAANQAQQLLKELNDREGEKYYLNRVIEDFTELPQQIAIVTSSKRRIMGKSIDKHGEERAWTKQFQDIDIVAVCEGGFLLRERFTAHRHRGEIRISGQTYDAFEESVKARWPNEYAKIMLEINV